MLSAFLLSWATDDTDTTDLHRFRFPFSTLSTPSHSGANEVFRRWTKCPSVPCEGSTLLCDARTE